jgi:succinoglycan biosynthesis transport protein ExoP
MERNTPAPIDYGEVLKRRKWSLILPALIVFVISAMAAFYLPSIYRSTSTILIEEQEIPDDFVVATVTSYAEQRLQAINKRIMSSSRLLDIINRFNLYPDLKDKWTTEEIVAKMREDIVLETISAETIDPRTGRAAEATIAFTLSYEGKIPDTVLQVANVLASQFLEENIRVRERQTMEASKFLEDEMEKVKVDLARLEAKLAEFKKQHINQLPEMLQANIQNMNNLENNLDRLKEQLGNLRERQGYLQTQLASIPPKAGEDKKRIDELKVQLAYLKSRFSDEYPDVIKTRAEIAELEKRIGASNNPSGSVNDRPDNPAYITLAAQLSSTQADIASVKRQINDGVQKANMHRTWVAATPKVEEAYNALVSERNNTQAKYNDLMRKLMEANVAYGLEKEQKGERFTLIDPAKFPEKPYKPNRLAILLVGFILSIGAGVGFASFREYSDHSVRSFEDLARVTAFPVLTVIPEIVTRKDRIRKRRKLRILTIGGILFIIIGLLAFHYLVMDFNVFWAKLMRKMAL